MNTKLRQAREKAKLTQTEVAEKAGITPMCYQRYEYGVRVPKVTVALKLAEILNVGISELFGDNGDIPKE